MTYCKDFRIDAANEMLKCFAPGTTLRLESGYVLVEWENNRGKQSKRWMTRGGQDFYPVWHRHWAHGGSACTALSQLVRWVQGRPVLSINSWRYWGREECALLRHGDREAALQAMLDAGYPAQATCVLCKQPINGSLDWWSLDGVSGPCCGWTSGCRQKVA